MAPCWLVLASLGFVPPHPALPRSVVPRAELIATDGRRPEYSTKQRLREEIESPFRKLRQTLFTYSAISASVAAFITASRLIGCLAADKCIQPTSETLPNLGIDLGAVAFCSVALWADNRSQESKLRRIAKGGQLASLQLVVPAETGDAVRNVAMAALRGDKRVAIVAGGEEVYRHAVATAMEARNDLAAGDLVVLPVLLAADAKAVDSRGSAGGVIAADVVGDGAGVVGQTRGPDAWGDWLETEVATARKQGFDVVGKGISLVVKKSGKIAKRSTCVPDWAGLVEDLQQMDRNYGMPF